MLEKAEHALDAVAIPVAVEVAGDRRLAVGPRRDDRQNIMHQQGLANMVAVVAFVRQKSLGLGEWQGHKIINGAIVRGLPTGHDKAKRSSLIVTSGVDFARKAAA